MEQTEVWGRDPATTAGDHTWRDKASAQRAHMSVWRCGATDQLRRPGGDPADTATRLHPTSHLQRQSQLLTQLFNYE